MTGTKLGFLSAASTQRASTALARTGTRAIDDAILAQVAAVAVAIGSGVNRGRTTHFIIDLSFLVALDRRVQFIDGAHTLAHREARAASCHGGFFGDPESALSARAAWSVLPSAQPGPDLILHTRDSASTEALTLRLCFEAKNPRRAKALADELADHVAVWDAAAASLRDTMERIRALIFETWLPKSRGASAHSTRTPSPNPSGRLQAMAGRTCSSSTAPARISLPSTAPSSGMRRLRPTRKANLAVRSARGPTTLPPAPMRQTTSFQPTGLWRYGSDRAALKLSSNDTVIMVRAPKPRTRSGV